MLHWIEVASGHACLAINLKRRSFSFSPPGMMFAVSFSYMALFCWGKFLLYLICWEAVCFFFFNHKRVLNFVKWLFCTYWDDHVTFIPYFVNVAWSHCGVNLHMWLHPCIPAINPTWSWCAILSMCSWVQFARILLRTCASMFTNLFHFLLKHPLPVRSFLTTIFNIWLLPTLYSCSILPLGIYHQAY